MAALNRVTATANGVGIFINGANGRVTLTDTATSSNNYGDQQQQLWRWRHRIGHHGAQFDRQQQCGGNSVDQNAVVRVGQTTITSNGIGTNGGRVQTYTNNNVSGNTTHRTAGSILALRSAMTHQ